MTRIAVAVLVCGWGASAHVGSPDVFFEGAAGPYRVSVVVRPPAVIPGVAEVEVRCASSAIDRVLLTPVAMVGESAKHPPTADLALRDKSDPGYFTGSLWFMVTANWNVRVRMEGAAGKGELSVPVPAAAQRTMAMDRTLAGVLGLLCLILSVGVVSIVSAAVREAQVEPGGTPGPDRLLRSRRYAIGASVAVVTVLVLGRLWWSAEAGNYDRYIYKPLAMTPSVEGDSLRLRLTDPGWIRSRALDDFLPDHGHLMHLFVVRAPELDRVWHLHPERVESGEFRQALPALAAGEYRLFADVVHGNGFPETLTALLTIPATQAGRALEGDDSHGQASSFGPSAPLSGGHRLVWSNAGERLRARAPASFRFRVDDDKGKPVRDLELYMGMQGHAVFLKKDLTVFAHVHPGGTVPMAALALVAGPHSMHAMGEIPAEVSFPYGLPSPGEYRVFVQVKRSGSVETGMFDVSVPAE